MKARWLRQSGAPELLIFFHGWSMDETTVAHLAPEELDVLLIWDYSDWEEMPDWSGLARNYATVRVLAWSLGVWAAARSLGNGPAFWREAVALNGSLWPVDATYGIAPEIFAGTAEHWLEEGARRNFYRRCRGGTGGTYPARNPLEQQRELRFLEEAVQQEPVHNVFDRAVIGTRDRIFGAAALRAAWSRLSEIRVTELDLPHDPLWRCHTWREVMELGA